MRLEGARLLVSPNRITFLAPLRLAFPVSPATGSISWSFLRPVQWYLHSILAPTDDDPNTATPDFHIVGTIATHLSFQISHEIRYWILRRYSHLAKPSYILISVMVKSCGILKCTEARWRDAPRLPTKFSYIFSPGSNLPAAGAAAGSHEIAS